LITIVCVPACDAVFDGTIALGASPIFKHVVKSGTHNLRLRAGGHEKTVTTHVGPDETAFVRESFDQ
jgi:hypothetical protein